VKHLQREKGTIHMKFVPFSLCRCFTSEGNNISPY
jgi:hypothetical protein